MENNELNVQVQPEVNTEVNVTETLSDFTSYLSEDLRPAALKFQGKSADDVFKSYSNLESVLGKKIDQLTPDEANILKGLQGFVTVDNVELPEDISGPIADWFKEVAPKAGLTKDGVKELVSSYLELEGKTAEARTQELVRRAEETEAALKKEYGQAYESRLNLAGNLVKNLGGEELLKDIEASGLGANPRFIKMIMDIASQFESDKLPSSQRGNALGVTPADAGAQIQTMMADSETRYAYYNKHHPKHEMVKAEITKLYAIAYPD